MRQIRFKLIFLGLWFFPIFVQAASRLEQLMNNLQTKILNPIISLLFILATVYFFWGVIQMIAGTGDPEKIKLGKQHMIWGIIGMTVMVGAWGIVRLIANFLGV